MRAGKVLTFVNREVNMKLVRIAREQWDVLAVLDSRERCPVLDFLGEPNSAHRTTRGQLLVSLRVVLPVQGPPRNNVELCKSLGDGVFELRRQTKGPKLRVLFFYDDECRIVFTNGFAKTKMRSKKEIDLAKSLKKQYFAAKSHEKLEILEVT
jgi:phage-related protein